jgi:hypothetical protein
MRPFSLSLVAIVALLGHGATAFAQSPSAPSTASAPTIVILVRHAEKAAEPANDPPLTAGGTDRAAA